MKLSIFDHMDLQTYLQEVYRQRKESSVGFSYASWARELGFTNKTILRLILLGKRQVTVLSGAKFKMNLALSAVEATYFDALVNFSQSKNITQRQALGMKLIQLQRQNFSQPVVSAESGILTDVYGPIALMVISSSEKLMTFDLLSKLLGLSEERVQVITNSLQRANLIIEEKEGFRALQNTFKIADQPQQESLKVYYRHWIHESAEAIRLPVEVRRFRSLQFLLTPEEFQESVNKINEFSIDLLSRFQTNTLSERKIYLMNTALFPIDGSLEKGN